MAGKKGSRKPRKTQSKKATEELSVEPVETVSQPVVEPVVESVVEPVVEPVVETQPISVDNSEVTSTPTEEVDEITQIIRTIQEQQNQIQTIQREINNNVKTLDRLYAKERKKNQKKKRTHNPDRKPSGFAKPSLLSDELCKFVGKPKGSMMARTEVTKYITGYIKEHNLQDPDFKRRIIPDKSLNKLLKVPKNSELTYFNLQTYMKSHFPKPVETSS